jgi:hypothetical protein
MEERRLGPGVEWFGRVVHRAPSDAGPEERALVEELAG